MPKLKKTTGLVLIGALALLPACSKQRTQANEWGCSFGDGSYDTRALKHAYAPGESGPWSNDRMVTGPADRRFHYIDSDPNTADFGGQPIVVPARGSSESGVGVVDVRAETQVSFVINERFCDFYTRQLKRLDERTKLNYNAKQGEESGWAEFLNLTFNQKMIEAARPVLAPVDYITLYINGPIGDDGGLAYDVLAREFSTNLSRELKNDLGDEYFCGPSYKFDGTIDGSLDNGCPSLEVTVKRIVPVDETLIQKLRDIVANEEQARKIESDTALNLKETTAEQQRTVAQTQASSAKAIAKAAADQAQQVAEAEAQREVQIAQTEAQRQVQIAQTAAQQEVELAQTARDLAVAQARGPVATQLAENKIADQHAEAQFCIDLASVNIRCDLLAAAENSNYPQYNLSGSADGGNASTVILDARP